MNKLSRNALAALIAATSVMAISAAQAQSIVFTGDTTTSDLYDRHGGSSAYYHYDAHPFTLVDPVAFQAWTASNWDTYIYLYSGSFDPSNPTANLVAYDDDGLEFAGDSILTSADLGSYGAGNYVLVVTGFSSSSYGYYVLTIDGAIAFIPFSSEDVRDELEAITAQGGRATLSAMSDNLRKAVTESFSQARSSSKGFGDLSGETVHFWTKGGAIYVDGKGERWLRSPLIQFGADVQVSPEFVAGLALTYGDLTGQNSELQFDGRQRLIQPYVGWQSGPWSAAASIVAGSVDYDEVTTIAGSSSLDGDMLGFTAEVARDYKKNAYTITPFVGVRHGLVDFGDIDGDLATSDLSSSVHFTETSLGANVSRALGRGNLTTGLALTYFDTDAVVDLASGSFEQTGWSGSANLGYSAQINANTRFDAEVSVGGIGADDTSYKGSLSLRIAF